jgi:hypothetical protein
MADFLRSLTLISLTIGVIFLFVSFKIHSDAPEFRLPLKTNHEISGSFGELRSNHFHAGIDLVQHETGIGTPVYAAADGYISRIKVKPGGYGNALYLDHISGYASVYAHLDRFTVPVQDYVRSQQYSRESFYVNLYPGREKFRVKQGELIGYMGNSGHSYGPHLHFEIRKHQIPVNPLQFVQIQDNTKPVFKKILIQEFNHHKMPLEVKEFNIPNMGDTIDSPFPVIGLSALVIDPQNDGRNRNGVYELELLVNDKLAYHIKHHQISFSNTRYANAHMDYATSKSMGYRAYRMHKLPGNRLNLSSQKSENGLINLTANPKKIELRAKDYHGNESKSIFFLRAPNAVGFTSSSYNYLIPYDELKTIEFQGLKLQFPAYALYSSMYLNLDCQLDQYFIGDPLVPLHRYIDLTFEPDEKDRWSSKSFLAHCSADGEYLNSGGHLDGNGLFRAKIRAFGAYQILEDTIPPEIELLGWNREGASFTGQFRISDNYQITGKAKGLSYEGQLDGSWTLLKYDAKTGMLFWNEKMKPGEHKFSLAVRDDRGNEVSFVKKFRV